MGFSLVGQAAGSNSAPANAGHYEFLRTIQHFACGQLNEDSYSGIGNGKIKRLAVMAPNAPKEIWTITCDTTIADGGNFTVVGSISGAQADATVGALYVDDIDNPTISFLIEDGSVDFAVNDAFTLSSTNGIRSLYDGAYSGTGNGEMLNMRLLDEVTETWTLTCTVAAPNAGTFSVTGSVSGARPVATVGVPYDEGIIQFLIADGTIDFAVNDEFVLEAIAQEQILADRWLVKYFDDTADDYELILEGPGIVGVGSVFCQFKTIQDTPGDYYNIGFSTSQGYIDSNSWEAQPNIDPKTCMFWNFNIPYELRISPRQIEFFVDIETRFDAGVVGLYPAFFKPTQYPYPGCQFGSKDGMSTTRYSDETRNFGLALTGSGSTATGTVTWIDGSHIDVFLYPDEEGEFSTPALEPTQSNTIQSYTGTGNGTIERYTGHHDAPLEVWTITKLASGDWGVSGSISGAQIDATEGVEYNNGFIYFTIIAGGTAFVTDDEFVLVITVEYSLEKIVIASGTHGLLGELEGLHWVSGFGNSVGNTFNDGVNVHAAFRDISRTGFNNYRTLVRD